MMYNQPYKRLATAIMVGLLLAGWIVFPLFAQSTQNSGQATSGSANPCITPGQSATQNQNANQAAHVGLGPDDAGAPLDCWLTLNGRQWHWYKFRYGYNRRTDNPPHQADIELTMNNAGCIRFELWTPERLKAAKDDPSLGPVGTGTPKFTPADPKSSSSKNQIPTILTWSGSQAGSSTFYVIVKNRTDAACTYHLSISGKSVFYPKTTK